MDIKVPLDVPCKDEEGLRGAAGEAPPFKRVGEGHRITKNRATVELYIDRGPGKEEETEHISLHLVYEEIRRYLENLQITGLISQMLGWGEEIKAKELDGGKGYWRKHERQRQQVRELFLSIPYKHSGVSFIVVIDKHLHFEKYANPEDPERLAM
ncbi:MAG: hypothetical protein IMX03_08435 [Brockia lithotrophica]|nr:hypothetical protein [Brockia lithotrophica]